MPAIHRIYLLLGSNLGQRESHVGNAREGIAVQIGTISSMSSLYETGSWGNTGLPAFINQVIGVDTVLTAQQVLVKILAIEGAGGRVREERWGSRIIDIDLLFFDDLIVDEPGLTVPHPQLHLRKFTLVPFSEINPTFIHPVLKKTINQLLQELKDTLPVIRLN